jgi:copper resistance protein D
VELTLADVLALALRAASFVAVLQAAGVPMFTALFASGLSKSLPAIEGVGRRSAAVALLLAIAQQAVEPARLAGSLRGVFDPTLQAILLGSPAGMAAATRVLGLALVLTGWWQAHRAAKASAAFGALLVVVSFTLMGHTTSHEPRWPLAGLLILHIAVVAFWLGALVPLRIAITNEDRGAAVDVLTRFSRVAAWLVPLIGVAGGLLAALLLPGLRSLGTPFGLALLAKSAGFAALLGLGALNKWRLVPRLATGGSAVARALQRSILAERLIIVLVLAITALLTGLFAPPQ